MKRPETVKSSGESQAQLPSDEELRDELLRGGTGKNLANATLKLREIGEEARGGAKVAETQGDGVKLAEMPGDGAKLAEMPDGFVEGISDDAKRDLDNLIRESSANFLRRDQGAIDQWYQNRTAENWQFLSRKSPHLARVYRNLLSDPELRFQGLASVSIEQLTPDEIQKHGESNALFYAAVPTWKWSQQQGRYIQEVAPTVRFNFDNPDVYTGQYDDFKSHLAGINANLAQMALRAGAKPKDVANNPRLVQAFVLAHELGHAHDFMTNYLLPERDTYPTGSKKMALPTACEKFWRRSKKERLGMTVAAGGKSARDELFYGRFKEKDIRNSEEAKFLHSASYRHQKQEWHADSFAARYIWRHYDDFFCDKNDRRGLAEGKVPTRIGDYMRVGEDALVALEYFASSRVQLQQLDEKNRPTGAPMDVYLEKTLHEGENLKFSTSGDPLDPDRDTHLMTRSPIREIGIVPTRTNNGIEPVTYLTAENGDKYMMTHVRDPKTGEYMEAPEIEETAEEARKRLGLEAGSTMRIMKRELQGSSAVLEGKVLSGSLRAPFRKQQVVYLDNLRDGLDYGNTSAVTRVYRKWKTYYFETSGGPKRGGSVYEILRGRQDKRP